MKCLARMMCCVLAAIGGRRAAYVAPCSVALAALWAFGCGRPDPDARPKRPSEVLSFEKLYGQHCAGCHGAEGKLGPAPPLNDPLFLAIASGDDMARVVTAGRKGTLMPAFAREHGGPLAPKQVEALVAGIRSTWSADIDERPAKLPAYSGSSSNAAGAPAANLQAGSKVFAKACAHCHGADGRGGDDAGPLNDAVFLALVSDQFLRRIAITGRLDLGMPDYRHMSESGPLTAQDITDVVAYVASWRGQWVGRLARQNSFIAMSRGTPAPAGRRCIPGGTPGSTELQLLSGGTPGSTELQLLSGGTPGSTELQLLSGGTPDPRNSTK